LNSPYLLQPFDILNILTYTILLIYLNSEAVFYYKAKNRFEKTPCTLPFI